jgi:hypothetical protein
MSTTMSTSGYINYAVRCDHSSRGSTSSTSPMLCARLLVSRQHRLYLNLVVRHDYSSPDRMGSTSTTLCAVSTRLSVALALHQPRLTARLLVARLHRFYCAYVIHPAVSSCRSTTQLQSHQQSTQATKAKSFI